MLQLSGAPAGGSNPVLGSLADLARRVDLVYGEVQRVSSCLSGVLAGGFDPTAPGPWSRSVDESLRSADESGGAAGVADETERMDDTEDIGDH